MIYDQKQNKKSLKHSIQPDTRRSIWPKLLEFVDNRTLELLSDRDRLVFGGILNRSDD